MISSGSRSLWWCVRACDGACVRGLLLKSSSSYLSLFQLFSLLSHSSCHWMMIRQYLSKILALSIHVCDTPYICDVLSQVKLKHSSDTRNRSLNQRSQIIPSNFNLGAEFCRERYYKATRPSIPWWKSLRNFCMLMYWQIFSRNSSSLNLTRQFKMSFQRVVRSGSSTNPMKVLLSAHKWNPSKLNNLRLLSTTVPHSSADHSHQNQSRWIDLKAVF